MINSLKNSGKTPNRKCYNKKCTMAVEIESVRALASTPSSTTSGCLSADETPEDHLLPSNLAHEELQLALNKVLANSC